MSSTIFWPKSPRMSRVMTLLRTREELCAMSDLYADALSNGRNDISTLIARGWHIERWWVKPHDSRQSAHKHYKLVSEPRTVTLTSAQPKSAHQLSLAEAGR